MKKLMGEFRDFAVKGNVIDLAVGVIVGGAFSTITNSLVNDIIMPFVSMFLGGINFSDWKIVLPNLFGAELETPLSINYGTFISTIINFIILAFVVFMIVKFINKARAEAEKKKQKAEEEAAAAAAAAAAAEPEAPKAPTTEELLAEILAELKAKK